MRGLNWRWGYLPRAGDFWGVEVTVFEIDQLHLFLQTIVVEYLTITYYYKKL